MGNFIDASRQDISFIIVTIPFLSLEQGRSAIFFFVHYLQYVLVFSALASFPTVVLFWSPFPFPPFITFETLFTTEKIFTH